MRRSDLFPFDDASGDANARATSRWAARADGVDDAPFVLDDEDFGAVGFAFCAVGSDRDADPPAVAVVVEECFADALPVDDSFIECPADGPTDVAAAAALSSTRNETRNQVRPSRFASGYSARSAASIAAAVGKPSAWASASVR